MVLGPNTRKPDDEISLVIDSSHIITAWKLAENYQEKKRLERLEEYKQKLIERQKKKDEGLDVSQSSKASSDYPEYRERSSEKFINEFVDKCYIALELDKKPNEKGPDDEVKEVSKLHLARLFYALMQGHGYIEAWDDKQFHAIYDLFQEDENEENLGLDKNEFTKMIKRLAQL